MSFPYSLCCKVPFLRSCQSKGLLAYCQWAALLGSCTEVIARLMAQTYESINCFKVNFYVKLQILLNHGDTFKMSLFSLQQNMIVPLWKVKKKAEVDYSILFRIRGVSACTSMARDWQAVWLSMNFFSGLCQGLVFNFPTSQRIPTWKIDTQFYYCKIVLQNKSGMILLKFLLSRGRTRYIRRISRAFNDDSSLLHVFFLRL